MAEKTCPLTGRNITNLDVLLISRAKLLHEIGVLEGISWAVPQPFCDAIEAVITELYGLAEREES